MVLSMDRWINKVAVVTGASSGIGAAIAEILVEEGLQVVGIARRVELVEAKAKELSSKKGKLIPYKADLSIEAEIIAAFAWIQNKVGAVSILINNAGVAHENTLIGGDSKRWKITLDLNVLGLCIATREAIEQMRKEKIDGHIIHINSIAGHAVPKWPKLNVYPASKYAVTALTETLRNEINYEKLKIKITSISPGLVESELTVHNKKIDKIAQQLMKEMPILQPNDIAESIVYVLSTPEHVQIQELTIKPVGEPF